MKMHNKGIIIALLLFSAVSCKKEYVDPSGPSYDDVITDFRALTDISVGLQNWYSANRTSVLYTGIASSSLLTGETFVVNAGNTDENQLYQGGNNLQNTNAIVTGMWAVCNKIVFDADRVFSNVDKVVVDKGYASGLIAYTSIWKAMAIGTMAMYWDHVPDTTGANVNFITSKEGYEKAVAILNNAINVVNTTAIGTNFTSVIPKGVNIVNTLYALKARYALFAGDYATALEAAGHVNLVNVRDSASTFNYSTLVTNPIFTTVTSTNNVYQVVDSTMGLPNGLHPDLNDKREPFYVGIATTSYRYRVKGFYNATDQAIPIFLPGEIMLIKAECYARQSNVPQGLIELNKVVTKQPSADPFGVGAGLPAEVAATQGELLTLIYKHRRIELFMAGLALEDERRFGRPAAERKRSYFPFPFVERNDNSNTPEDPAF